MKRLVITFFVLSMAAMPAAALEPLISKMSKAEIAGAIFNDKRMVRAIEQGSNGEVHVEDVETFLSSNKLFDAGMYRSGPSTFDITEGYGVDEFMYFLEGGVTLTATDGTVTEIEAGDAVTIAKEWKGTWHSDGYTKIYVIYSRDEPLTQE